MNKTMLKNNTTNKFFPFICLLTVVTSIFYLFSSAAIFLSDDWSRDEYSHGFLLPLLAILMGWHRLSGWHGKARSNWFGIVIIAVSIGLLFISEISTFRQLSYFSMVLTLFGLSLTYLGTSIVKRLTPVFILLLFAIPIPFIIYNPLSLFLKLLSTSMGVFLIDLFGYSVYQDGNIIDLGTFKLQVVDACNGLRYLFPSASFGFLIAYLMKDVWWKRAVIFLSSAPITIAMNALRIAVVGVTVNIWGTTAAEGFLHIFEGFVVFLLCIVLLMIETMLLLRIGTKGTFNWDFFSIPQGQIYIRPVLRGNISIFVSLLCVLATLAMASGYTKSATHSKSHEISSLHIPTIMRNWQGKQSNLSPYALNELKLTDYVLTDYKNVNNPLRPDVNLYIAYYASQTVGSTIHSPATCLPGGGWQREQSRVISLSLQDQEVLLPVTRMIVSKGDQKLVTYYWYHERGRNLTNQISAKWYLLVDSLFKRRSDGSLIRLTTPILGNNEEDNADERLRTFLNDFYPVIIQNLTGHQTEENRP